MMFKGVLATLLSSAAADNLSGSFEGQVPFIIDVSADFDGSGAKADVDVNVKIASTRITCPGEKIQEDDSQVIFPDAVNDGDCLGDGVRSDSKDPSKYIIGKNADGTLTFKSDGYPDLKLKKKSLKAADTCSLYEIADGSCGQSDLDCTYVKYAKAAEKGLADGTCPDHGYPVKAGSVTKTYPIIGDIVVTTYSQGLRAADNLSGSFEGKVPFIIDVEADFDGSGAKADVDVNVKVASTRITCPGEKIQEDDSQVIFPDAVNDGDCLGDGVRSDSKDPSKYIIGKNADGTLTFKSDGYPDLKLKKKAIMV